MRNNPKTGIKLEYSDIFDKYARIEKLRRFFSIKRQKMYKHFMLQPYQANFVKRHIKDFIKAIDTALKMEGKLEKNFKTEEQFMNVKEDEVISFEQFYEILGKWAISQDKLSYDDFALHEEENARLEELDAFKKMTDRIL